ncbi:MAG TPA: FKBP-type peptidyl-prolyl cis-trans isomerase [Burkholderiaceae bacterium]|nr:FKBP-type peptidyl-prolyl cis-trans isomerase [Burkholderiaceae bacterium]
MKKVGPDSHVTLHYRLAILAPGDEREIFSTFGGHPATVQIGAGHMASPLEHRLVGLEEGQRVAFELSPEDGFGERNAALVQTLTRAAFDRHADRTAEYEAGDVIALNLPERGTLAGVLKWRDEQAVVVDFNHPLAGRSLRFSVHVIGVI